MTGEWGHLWLIVAAVAAAVQAGAGLLPSTGQLYRWQRLQHLALAWQVLGLVGAFVGLSVAFVGHDFSLRYVAEHSHHDLPLLYRVAAVWGGHEGSMLLWCLVLSGWSVAAARSFRGDARGGQAAQAVGVPEAARPTLADWAPRVLGVLGLVALAMLSFVLLTSNPFERLLPAAAEGRSLNPLLQDPGLVLHPPLLYLGYVGSAVPFAMTLATLGWGGPPDWAGRARPFTATALAALSLGIALGSWWAYYELGWGGWWFWDPVENASLMPWLAQAALLHSLVVRERRGGLAHWSALLALGAFVLALLGTFLVRSGVLTSVHAFASDPRRGSFMLGLIAAALAVCFSLYARHAHRLLAERVGQGSAWCSRDLALQLNNLGLAVACASVLLGTVYPLAMDALGWGKLSVGAPYFDTVMAPLLLWLAALAVPAIWLGWGREPVARLRRRLRPTVWVTGLAAPALAWGLAGYDGPWPAATWLALCVATAVATSTLDWARQRGARPVPAHTTRVGHFGAGPAGMVLAHLGVAVFMVGVAMVNGLGQERDVRLAPGDQVALGGCQLQLTRLAAQPGPNWQAVQGQFLLRCPDEAPRALTSEKRVYVGAGMPLSESAIDVGWSRDLYVALGEPLTSAQTPGQSAPSFDPQAAWSVRVQVKPFIRWVWAGVLLMAVGCALAALQRWRPARVPAHDPAPGLPPPVTPDPHAALN